MKNTTHSAAGKVFINYRRADSEAWAGRLYDRLETAYGADRLFMDVDTIPAGRDFHEFLNEQVSRCAVLLALVGRDWLTIRDDRSDQPRLEDPSDFVRVEIAAAMAQGVRVIPILLGDTPMPSQEALPEPLKPFSRLNAVRLTHAGFNRDVAGLREKIDEALAELDAEVAARVEAAWRQVADSDDPRALREFAAEHAGHPQAALALDRIRGVRRGQFARRYGPIGLTAAIAVGVFGLWSAELGPFAPPPDADAEDRLPTALREAIEKRIDEAETAKNPEAFEAIAKAYPGTALAARARERAFELRGQDAAARRAAAEAERLARQEAADVSAQAAAQARVDDARALRSLSRQALEEGSLEELRRVGLLGDDVSIWNAAASEALKEFERYAGLEEDGEPSLGALAMLKTVTVENLGERLRAEKPADDAENFSRLKIPEKYAKLFAPPGQLTPGSGTGLLDNRIYVPNMRFPIEMAPAYSNSQAWGVGGFKGTKGSQCAEENYQYPWRSNLCEIRRYKSGFCPTGTGHEGVDFRPATCEKDKYWAVAAVDGVISDFGRYTVTLRGDNGLEFRYMHLNVERLAIGEGERVKRGQRIGLISDYFGGTPTTIHLHFEARRVGRGADGKSTRQSLPLYASAIDAYIRLLEGAP